MSELDYCVHTHTKRCGHAYGNDEEYVKSAIMGGFKVLGFSDHAMLPDLLQNGMRGSYALFPGYVESIRSLQKKYQSQIVMRLGMESEWFGAAYAKHYASLLSSGTLDYLILGQHCYLAGGDAYFYGDTINKVKALQAYEHDLIEGMETGLFLYVCHPDLFMYWYPSWDEETVKSAKHIIAKAKELGIPLEVNMGPSRWRNQGIDADGELLVPYPNPHFWDLVSQAGVPVTIGVDAHGPDQFLISDYAWVLSFVKRHNLHLLSKDEVLTMLDEKKNRLLAIE